MIEYTLTAEAKRDLIDIFLQGLELFGPAQAEKYSEEMKDHFLFIAGTPSVGTYFESKYTKCRRSVFISHSIYYETYKDNILILRVLHNRQDPARHLSS